MNRLMFMPLLVLLAIVSSVAAGQFDSPGRHMVVLEGVPLENGGLELEISFSPLGSPGAINGLLVFTEPSHRLIMAHFDTNRTAPEELDALALAEDSLFVLGPMTGFSHTIELGEPIGAKDSRLAVYYARNGDHFLASNMGMGGSEEGFIYSSTFPVVDTAATGILAFEHPLFGSKRCKISRTGECPGN